MAHKFGKGQLRDLVGVGSVINAEGHEGPTKRPTENYLGSLDKLTAQQMQNGLTAPEAQMNNPTFGQPKPSKKIVTPISESEKKG